MITARAEALLDRDVRTLSDDEWCEVAETFPDEYAYMMVRLKSRPGDPVSPKQLGLDLELTIRYPHSIDYYRDRAEDARWRRLDQKWRARLLAERLAASVPFEISAVAFG